MSARGWFLFSLMGVLWGIPYLMIKVAVGDLPPSTVVFVRCALGAALLLPFALRGGRLARTVRSHWKPMPAFAAIEIIGPWWTLTDAEQHLSSSMAGFLIAAVPIFGVILARLLALGDSERVTPRRALGLALALGGVAVLTVPHLSGGDAWSITELLLSAFGYALAPLIAARHLKAAVPTLQLVTPCLLLAALVHAPAGIAGLPGELPGGEVLLALAGLGILCTALAFVGFLELIREVGPSRASVITYVNPAVAVAAGVTFLDEPLTATIGLAFALILGGSVLATLGGAHADRAGGDAAPVSIEAVGAPSEVRVDDAARGA
ncbi:DMT family transporter [Streptomyces sp. NPDC060194]|uniref:DMT family transporter n=1 Tax=Streptomyces sp. NPDC060194 TaxID=3347069 RepID=UPI0036576709